MGQFKTISQLKKDALKILNKRWVDGILLSIIPSILQIITIATSTFVLFSYFKSSTDFFIQRDLSFFHALLMENNNFLILRNIVISLLIILINVGINYTFLDWLRNPILKFNPFKKAFTIYTLKYFLPILLVSIFIHLFVGLATLLLIVPGIILALVLSQTYFIYKDLNAVSKSLFSAMDYLSESNQIMKGHKKRLFLLHLSFIGWHFLSIITLGIGYLWLNPYIKITLCAFYRDISKEKYLI